MSQVGPVLDYASPRHRGKLRLPSRSVLEARRNDNGLVVTETLSGSGGARGAVAFGAVTWLILASLGVGQVVAHAGRWQDIDTVIVLLVGGVCAIELTVLLMVINNTWRKTVLLAHPERISVHFVAPFSKRHYVWPAHRVEDVRVVRTYEPESLPAWHGQAVPLGELELIPGGEPMAKLFTDHPEADLAVIARAAREMIAAAQKPVAVEALSPVPAPPPPVGDDDDLDFDAIIPT